VNQNIVIVGATSAMAEHCARLWVAESPKNMVLLGRDIAKTERVAQDLRVRSPQSSITVQTTDFADPVQIQSWVDQVCAAGVPDVVLIAHGTLPDQASCQQDLALNERVMQINGISPVLFAEGFVGHMEKANHGKLAIIGSVAGDRGRKSNYVYGAAKGLVTRYAQGLQHRLAKTQVKVVLIKPGPTATPMTAEECSKGAKMAAVSTVASAIVRGVSNSTLVVYAPLKWRLIMSIIQHLPVFIFKKIDI
jgi:decaprenylphospho-beta-D-erythro-pentofuranosid-2-ulose 2-reductase